MPKFKRDLLSFSRYFAHYLFIYYAKNKNYESDLTKNLEKYLSKTMSFFEKVKVDFKLMKQLLSNILDVTEVCLIFFVKLVGRLIYEIFKKILIFSKSLDYETYC